MQGDFLAEVFGHALEYVGPTDGLRMGANVDILRSQKCRMSPFPTAEGKANCQQSYVIDLTLIGSGITEAGCKVIFNQRMKQSGMRWHPGTGQYIVDLRTAVRGKLWNRIWNRIVSQHHDLPPITRRSTRENRKDSKHHVLLS